MLSEPESKSLYDVAKSCLEKENLKDPKEFMEFRDRITVEISDIDSQLKTAKDSGVTLNKRHRKGTQGYFTWRRKAESSRNIKSCQLHIIKRELEAFNVQKDSKWRRKYQEELTLRVNADSQVEILKEAINEALGLIPVDDSDIAAILVLALKEAQEV